MALILFIMGASLGVAVLCYHYHLQSMQRLRDLEAKLQSTIFELGNANQTEQALRKAYTDLQIRLDMALMDSVANVLGWQIFEDRVNQSVKESLRYQYTMGLMYVDLDEFRLITDAMGAEIGNEMLREVAMRIETRIRQVDSISRFSKDIFVVLLPQLNKPETAAIVAQRILHALAQPFTLDGREIYITACIGIAIFPADGRTTSELFLNAENALHQAKEKGRQLYQFYQERIHEDSQRELTLINDLRQETAEAQFVLYYQPIVNVKTESVFGMEALMHWQHPELGLIDQRDLFHYADRQSKLDHLTLWLVEHACKEFLRWRTMGFTPTLLAITLNFKQLSNTQFIYSLSQILKELNFEPCHLLLQLQGGTTPASFDVVEKGFNMLGYMGIKTAIADFGASTFNLRDLKRFPIQFLKLDPTLVYSIDHDEQGSAIVRSALYLTEALGMDLIVQGVETLQQMDTLKQLGCRYMQGQFIAPSMSEKEIEEAPQFHITDRS